MTKKSINPFKKNKNEIYYNLINAGLAGGLVLLGSFSDGDITLKGFCFAIITSMIVLITKFKEYWNGEANEYISKIFNFI